MTQALGNITSANAVLVLGVEELYPVGVQLTNFATDQMLSSDDMEIAQARMGVDGGLAAGYVPNPFSLTITLEASSPSLTVMQSLLMAMKTNKTTYKCSVTLTIPSIKQVATEGQSVLCDPATGAVTYGAAGAENDTGWIVILPAGLASAAEGDVVIYQRIGA